MYFVSFIIVSKRRKFKPQPWTQREKHNVSIYFEKYIHAGKAPGKDVCEEEEASVSKQKLEKIKTV